MSLRSLVPTSPAAALAPALAVALAISVTGCMGPRPPLPADAAVAAPLAWRTLPSSVGLPVDSNWWRAFGDPALDAVVERALEHNADLAQAVTRVTQARAAERLARSQRGPEIDVNNEGGRIRELETIGPVTANGDKAAAMLSWDFDLFRKLAESEDAARADLLASEATRDAVRLTVASATATAYITLVGMDARLQVARDTFDSRVQSVRFARRRVDTGYAAVVELRQAEGELASTAKLVSQAALAVTQQENALSVLTGSPPSTVARAPRGLDALTLPAVPHTLPSDLLQRRPDIAAAEDRVVAADHSLSAARRAMLPSVGLSANYAITVANVLPTAIPTYLFADTVLAPIFDSGRRRAVADRVAAERDQAAFAFRATVLTAFREVEDSLASATRLAEVRRSVDDEVEAQQSVVDVSVRRFAAGYDPYFNQIDARRQLLAARLDVAQTRADQLITFVQLCKALGGGWDPAPTDVPDPQGDTTRARLVRTNDVEPPTQKRRD